MMTKPAPAVRSLPHPAIEDGNFSFPDGKYQVTTQLPGNTGDRVILHHQLTGAPFIERLLKMGEARFACLVSVSKTGYRKLHIAAETEARQEVCWDLAVVGEPPRLGPLVLYLGTGLKHRFTEQDGVAPLWRGRDIDLPRGVRLARGRYRRPAASIANLLTVRRNEELPAGSFTVADNTNAGFYFSLAAAADIFQFLQNPQDNSALRSSILTHAVSQCFNILQRNYSASEEDDGADGGWEQHTNLVALAGWLQGKGMPHWSDNDFDAIETATRLYPIRVPAHKDEEA